MEDIYYEKVLNRIIQGRLRLRLGDLVLFIYEPTRDIIEESFDIYDEAYKKAYFSGAYIKDQVLEILLENGMWSPLDDKQAEDLEKQLEDLKVEAFASFVHKRKLFSIKKQIRKMERDILKLRHKQKQFDHMTCNGVANFARKCWLIERTTKTQTGQPYDFKEFSISTILDMVAKHEITPEVFRKVARSQPFRSMWSLSKKTGDLFGCASIDIDKNKLGLISYAQMYDSVYENPESPKDEIIEDDDCLDGWFIVQRRKYEKNKKQAEIDSMITNSKIANSDEIFIMTSQEEAGEIYGLNSPLARNKIKQRDEKIKADGHVKLQHLPDIAMDIYMQNNQEAIAAMKSKAKG
jgi:hypothetical protein